MSTPATFIQDIIGSPSRSNQVGKIESKLQKSKLSLLTDDMILYIENPGIP